jgi:hypothetical protein
MRLLQFASMNARSFSDSENEDVFGTPWFTFSLTHGCHFEESVSRFFLKVVAVSRRGSRPRSGRHCSLQLDNRCASSHTPAENKQPSKPSSPLIFVVAWRHQFQGRFLLSLPVNFLGLPRKTGTQRNIALILCSSWPSCLGLLPPGTPKNSWLSWLSTPMLLEMAALGCPGCCGCPLMCVCTSSIDLSCVLATHHTPEHSESQGSFCKTIPTWLSGRLRLLLSASGSMDALWLLASTPRLAIPSTRQPINPSTHQPIHPSPRPHPTTLRFVCVTTP